MLLGHSPRLVILVFAGVIIQLLTGVALGKGSNGSWEHILRKDLLSNYDKEVLPPGKPLVVKFAVRIQRLAKVDNKDELFTVDTWTVLTWENSFMKWNPKDYGDRDRVRLSPSEVWVPDIVLYNNGDSNTPFAGGRSKFLTQVTAEESGLMTWSGPATFVGTCEMSLQVWPFDKQKCSLSFGSMSYGNNLLDIEFFKAKADKSDRYLTSGDWDLVEINTAKTEASFGNCCPYNYTEIQYTLHIQRRYKYHMFYLVGPCLMLSILAVLGFFIPSESGERIGFVTTLLLAMMVFLLLIPDALPESSRSIPILGVFMMATLVMISCILLVTIMVLNFYHWEGHPPKWVQKMFCKSAKPTKSPIVGVEMNDKSEISLRAVQPYNNQPSSENVSTGDENAAMTYRELSLKLDKFFFWFFVVTAVVMFSIVLTNRG